MRFPPAYAQLQSACEQFLPHLRPSQHRGLALWVLGTLLARSGCQSAVIVALSLYGNPDALRQRLRDWLYDGSDKAKPCHTQLAVETCFAPLLRWILSWWHDPHLALALDATLDRDRHAALVLSVLYRGTALPVAWRILPANTKGAWLPHLLALLRLVWRAVPAEMSVIVLVDRGLWSPVLWRRLRRLNWHPLMRVSASMVMESPAWRASGRERVPGPGHVWVGRGRVGKRKARRHPSTMLVIWAEGQDEPWVVLTDVAPAEVGAGWYALRMWIECGFKVLKSVGWQWERMRRTDVTRVGRMWLVLSVATVWTVATGTRVADAQAQGKAPQQLRTPGATPATGKRTVSVFQLGITWLQHLARTRLWTRLWLVPDPWPEPPEGLQWCLDV